MPTPPSPAQSAATSCSPASPAASTTSDLFQPLQLGRITLSNRIVMAPLTRSRAEAGDVPSPMAPEYYRQRASAGLIISEASQISPQGKGYASTPGIYNAAQIEGWQAVTHAVHQVGGHIFLQLWHVGRVSHPYFQPGGALPVAPSAISCGGSARTEAGLFPRVTPRALDIDEIPGIVGQFRSAARNALEAGFDGVEIHAANGYLIEQFLRDGSNHRSDAYGGTIENRSRLLLEVTEAVAEACGGDRVGIRLSPNSPFSGMIDSDPAALFSHAVEQLNQFGLAYLHLVEGATGGPRVVENGFDLNILRRLFKGLYIANNGYDRALALSARAQGLVDLVAFGCPFISNPDLVERLRRDLPLNPVDTATLYAGGAKGYIDYPFFGGQGAREGFGRGADETQGSQAG